MMVSDSKKTWKISVPVDLIIEKGNYEPFTKIEKAVAGTSVR